MPVHYSKDKDGCYAQWGNSGAKYRYTCGDEASRKRAGRKAHIQGGAAVANGATETAKTIIEVEIK